MSTITEPVETNFVPSARSVETRYATSKPNVFLVVRTSHSKPAIRTRCTRVVIERGFATEKISSLIHDRAPVASASLNVARYSAKLLKEEHERFIIDNITEENFPALLEWAERAER